MLTRIGGKIVWECDSCGETLETDTTDFAEARRALTEDGWRASRLGRDWTHECPSCRLP